ncbi:50S ribosomal protein L10 [Thermatribacter velox]|uniref:Large ribosomal subunit protein uL10 n=1 Tax=Thermatribacter velox TaxID=3039681 RepID=A0ABZ2Y9K0_9BACT
MEKREKATIIEEVYRKLQESQAVYVFSYHGLNVQSAEELRRSLREASGEMKVIKNTLARIALQKANIPFDDQLLKGQNAFAFAYQDAVQVAKKLNEFSKKLPEIVIIKGGWLEKKQIGVDDVKNLASLPSREELVARVVGGIAAPLSGLVGVLQGVLRSLVWVLKAIEEKKQ